MFLVPTKPQRPEPCLPGSHLTKPERQKARASFSPLQGRCMRYAEDRAQPGLSVGTSESRKLEKSYTAGLLCSLLPDTKGHAFNYRGEEAFIICQPADFRVTPM